jgi:CRISPR system Cascade subunit CasE
MSLYLLQCRPDPAALTTWATRHRLLSPDGDDGYALHALLAAAFGEQAPKPFRYRSPQQGLLAYTEQSPATLRDHAALATPEIARALGLDQLAARPFPSAWRAGQPLGFEVRVRPVLRAKDGRERDLFLHAVETRSVPNGSSREAVYCDWLRRQCVDQGAAQVVQVGMEAFRLSRVVRRAQTDATGQRNARAPSGPDAVFTGQLRVGDSDAFTRLLIRGIGRHRAFGFGMLLLKPARPC